MKTVATIAGFDPTGGAGVLADQATFLAHGLECVAAVTCHVPQTADRVHSVHAISVELLRDELAALDSIPHLAAIKIGVLGSLSLLEPLAEWLDTKETTPVVVDPVLRSSDGTSLLPDAEEDALVRSLGSRALLFTPNLAEALTLAGLVEMEPAEVVGARLLERGMNAVLITSARQSPEWIEDLLMARTLQGGRPHWLLSARRGHPMPHGSGCRLSSAITANLARGETLYDAIDRAKAWFLSSLASSQPTPTGRYIFGPLPLDR